MATKKTGRGGKATGSKSTKKTTKAVKRRAGAARPGRARRPTAAIEAELRAALGDAKFEELSAHVKAHVAKRTKTEQIVASLDDRLQGSRLTGGLFWSISACSPS